jgi:hypothetical protein
MNGVVLVILAGLLQAGLSFSFVYSQDAIVTQFRAHDAGEAAAAFAVWPMVLVGGAATTNTGARISVRSRPPVP